MKTLNKKVILSMMLAILLAPAAVSAGVYFMESIDKDAEAGDIVRPCVLDYPKRSCPDGKNPQNFCPTDNTYFQTCGCDIGVYKFDASNCKDNKTLSGNTCDSKYDTCSCDVSTYKYDSTNCTNGKALSGNTCDGKYEACGCAAEYSKTCSTNNLIPADANDSCDGKYKACKCPTSYGTCTGSGQAGGAAGSAQCTEEDGTVKYASCKAEVNCEAPYYKNAEGSCVLWDDVAAVAKTCAELITVTKNANITGNVLVWGTLNCQENEIGIPVGQNIVGKGYYKDKYTEATDTDQNKFSKITWDFQTKAGFGLSVEHNTKLSDLTLEIKSNQPSKWIDWVSFNATPGLILVNTKQNLVFRNLDLKADVSTVENMGVNLIEGNAALTGSFTFEGNNYITLLNKTTTSSDGYKYASNTSTYFTKLVNMNLGQDAKLTILGDNGGAYYGVFHTKTNLTKNAQIYFKQTNPVSDTPGFKDYNLSSSPICKVVLKDTAKIEFDFGQDGTPFYMCPLDMYDNSAINAKAKNFLSGGIGSNSGHTGLRMYANSIINANLANGGAALSSAPLSLNSNAIFRIKSASPSVLNPYEFDLNDSSKLVIKSTATTSTYSSAIFYGWRTVNINGNSMFLIEGSTFLMGRGGLSLNSTNAIMYLKVNGTTGRVWGFKEGSNPEIWLYKTIANSRIFIETPNQNGYGGAEDDGLYLMPTLGVSADSNASICSHMTSGYVKVGGKYVNRDMACWTHGTINSAVNDPANPNNNDYLKGKTCYRCADKDGATLTGVTHVSKSDSRFTSAKSSFTSEMTALDSAMNF